MKVWIQKVGDNGEKEEEGGEKKSHRVEDQCEILEKDSIFNPLPGGQRSD